MKKIIKTLMATLLVATMLVGCGDAVSKELVDYINEGRKDSVASYGNAMEAVDKFTSLAGDSELVASINNDVVAELDSAISSLEKLELKEKEMVDLNDKYIAVYKEMRDDYAAAAESLAAGDVDTFTAEYQAAQDCNSKLLDVENELDKLCKEHDVDLTSK